jgi:hypothetical protein
MSTGHENLVQTATTHLTSLKTELDPKKSMRTIHHRLSESLQITPLGWLSLVTIITQTILRDQAFPPVPARIGRPGSLIVGPKCMHTRNRYSCTRLIQLLENRSAHVLIQMGDLETCLHEVPVPTFTVFAGRTSPVRLHAV